MAQPMRFAKAPAISSTFRRMTAITRPSASPFQSAPLPKHPATPFHAAARSSASRHQFHPQPPNPSPVSPRQPFWTSSTRPASSPTRSSPSPSSMPNPVSSASAGPLHGKSKWPSYAVRSSCSILVTRLLRHSGSQTKSKHRWNRV